MSLPPLLPALFMVCAGVCVGAQSIPQAREDSRLIAVGKLWATVHYFHPALSRTGPADWDAAFLRSIPKIKRARSSSEFADIATELLATLNDPASRILRNDEDGAATITGFVSAIERDGAVLITSGRTVGDPLESAPTVRHLLTNSQPVVFDLRPGRVHPWLWGAIERLLTAKPILRPAQRYRAHSGYVPPRGAADSPFFSGALIRGGSVTEPAEGGRDRTVAFLVNSSEQLPDLAPALQASGKGIIIAERPIDDTALVRRYRMELTDGLAAQIRLSELLSPDNSVGVQADRVVSGDGLSAALAAVKENSVQRRPKAGADAYVTNHPDPIDTAGTYPAEEFRIFAAFRIWAAFEWFSPYRELMDRDWDEVLRISVREFASARSALDYHLAVAEMLTYTQDTHTVPNSSVLSEFWGVAAPGIRVRAVEGRVIVTELLTDVPSGIVRGDEIVALDGESVIDRLKRLARYVPASTAQALSRDTVALLLRGRDKSQLRIRVRHADGAESEIRVERKREHMNAFANAQGTAWRMLTPDIGYIDLRQLTNEKVDEAFQALAAASRGIVFDMRGYPRNTRAAVAGWLTSRAQLVGAKIYRRLAVEPGSNTTQEFDATYRVRVRADRYLGKTVMLVDERAQSQSEATAQLLQAANGTVLIGTPTAGANGDGSALAVPGGIYVWFSGQGVRLRGGGQLQRVGLKPDIVVAPTVAGVRSGRDEVLEAAVQHLQRLPVH